MAFFFWIEQLCATWSGLGFVFLITFLCGAIPSGYLVGKLQGMDIRTVGSGNIGTTNVIRALGVGWGGFVLFADFFKAYLPLKLVYLATQNTQLPMLLPRDVLIVLLGVLVVLGHNYTPFLRFKGGKGVASSAGVLLVMMPIAFYATVVMWVLTLLLTRYASLASLVAATVLPIVAFFFYRNHPWFVGIAIILCILAFVRHRSNIVRLISGTESKFGRLKG